MKTRTISGAIIALVVGALIYFGGIAFDIGVAVAAIIAFKELLDVRKNYMIPPIMKIVGLVCMLLLTFVNIDGYSIVFGLSYETLSLVFILLLAPTVLLHKYNYRTNEAFYLASITIFLGVIFNLFIMLYNESMLLFIYIILVACITDIFALVGGKLIGKHKLTKISPGKTIEGSITGTLLATIVGTTYYVTLIGTTPLTTVIIITIVLSIVGQIGDIFFSLIKRENDIKDYSNLIPGHGGILDRLDSIIFILIAFVFIMQFL